jgi:hypothetical protein
MLLPTFDADTARKVVQVFRTGPELPLGTFDGLVWTQSFSCRLIPKSRSSSCHLRRRLLTISIMRTGLN